MAQLIRISDELRSELEQPSEFGPKQSKYPFETMDIGEAYVMTAAEESRWNAAKSAAINYGKRVGKRFRSKRLTNGTFCVWRIEDDLLSPASFDVITAEANKRFAEQQKNKAAKQAPTLEIKQLPADFKPLHLEYPCFAAFDITGNVPTELQLRSWLMNHLPDGQHLKLTGPDATILQMSSWFDVDNEYLSETGSGELVLVRNSQFRKT